MYATSQIRLYPSRDQEKILLEWEGHTRWLWNHLLALNIKRHEQEGRFLFKKDMKKLLVPLRKEYPWLSGSPFNSLQDVCVSVDKALRRTFSGKTKNGFPRFKKKGRSSYSFYIQYVNQRPGYIKLPKIPGEMKYRGDYHLTGREIRRTLKRERDGRWILYTVFEIQSPQAPSGGGEVLGIDVGIRNLCADSDGCITENPSHYRQDLEEIRFQTRSLSRKIKGSNRYEKQRKRLADRHRRVADRRKKNLESVTREIANREHVGTIALETLRVSSIKKRFGKSASDASIGHFIKLLEWNCHKLGKRFVRVPWNYPSSQICSTCGAAWGKLDLGVTVVTCGSCGTRHDRDVNAATNIRDYVVRSDFGTLKGHGEATDAKVSTIGDGGKSA